MHLLATRFYRQDFVGFWTFCKLDSTVRVPFIRNHLNSMKLKMPSRTERKFVQCHVNVALVKHLSGDNMRGLSWDLNKCGENVKNSPLSPKIGVMRCKCCKKIFGIQKAYSILIKFFSVHFQIRQRRVCMPWTRVCGASVFYLFVVKT